MEVSSENRVTADRDKRKLINLQAANQAAKSMAIQSTVAAPQDSSSNSQDKKRPCKEIPNKYIVLLKNRYDKDHPSPFKIIIEGPKLNKTFQ